MVRMVKVTFTCNDLCCGLGIIEYLMRDGDLISSRSRV